MINEFVNNINALFKAADFETINFSEQIQKTNRFCFDIFAKKNDQLFTVKVFQNIDNLSSDFIGHIKALSSLLNSKPILIGIKNRYQNLEDDTIYIREELPFITLNTLRHILKKNLYPHILARRGGGVVFLDGNLMKVLREKKNFSRKELSEKLGVTKRTVCSYENECLRPSEAVALKILDLLENKSLLRKINVFEWNIKFSVNHKDVFNIEELSSYESHLRDLFEELGVSSYWYKKGQIPFKLTLYSGLSGGKNSIYPIFSNVSEKTSKFTESQYNLLNKFTELLRRKVLLIVDDELKIPPKVRQLNIPIVRLRKLEKLDDENEFINLIQDSGRT